jgi:D-alanyl-D-alanine carboxypeptidase (penicillin-binding protein 5/6)
VANPFLSQLLKKISVVSTTCLFAGSIFAQVAQPTNVVTLPIPNAPDASTVATVSVAPAANIALTAAPTTGQVIATADKTTQVTPPATAPAPTPATVNPTSVPAPAPTVSTSPNPQANTATNNANTIPIATPKSTAPAAPTLPAAGMLTNITPTPPPINAAAYLLIDANSGYIIAQSNSDARRAPASLTKLMTMYVISGLIKSERIKLTDPVTISENAWRTGGSRMFVQVGTQVPVQDLVNGIVVASGNDACVAMSEYVAGSEPSFVDLMNKTAQQLNMQSTHYADATGLPSPQNYTTAKDLSMLSRAIINNYPEDYKWYSQKWMLYNNIKQPNRNLLLWRDPTVDGLKTGHTDDAGYCLVASALRNNMRLISIVLGAPSMKQRAVDVEALLNYGYRFFETQQLYSKNKPLANLKTWYAKKPTTQLGLAKDMYVTVPTGQYKNLSANVVLDKLLAGPIVKGQPYGTVQVSLNNQVIASQPLVALEDNAKAGFFSRTVDSVTLMFKRWFK